MNFKKLILVLVITTAVLITSLLGFSYAWYATTSLNSTLNYTTLSSSDFSVQYLESSIITTTVGVPIASVDVESKSYKNVFVTDMNIKAVRNVKVDVKLVDISIANELKDSTYFRYQLFKNGEAITNVNDFSLLGIDTELILYTRTYNADVTAVDNYELRVWLEESGGDQNSLMNKTFRARIKVSAYYITS